MSVKARTRTARREFDVALSRLEPRLARAFRAAVRRAHARVSLTALAAALDHRDVEAAVELVGADALGTALRGEGVPPGEDTFQDGLLAAVRAGADVGTAQLPRAAALAAALSLTNPRSLSYLTENLPTLIREVTDEARRVVRDVVQRGFTEGRPTRLMAWEIRETVGLTRAQATAVGNFRRQLETGAGPGKAPWARRLSATERQSARSIFTGGGERSARVERLVDRYRESLVNRRAKNIARTETTRALGAGQSELWRQATERGLLDPAVTRRRWVVTPDERLRPDHAAVPAMNPDGVGLDEPFQTPVGPVMAPRESGVAAFDVNCRCTVALAINE